MAPTDTAPSPFSTLPASEHPGGVMPDGVTHVTTAELRFLTEWNYGPDAARITCEHCGDVMVFERHPADWPNHPGDPSQPVTLADGTTQPAHVRVKIECPVCGGTQYTDGMTERDYVDAVRRDLTAQVADEVARRMAEGTTVTPVDAGDEAGSTEHGG